MAEIDPQTPATKIQARIFRGLVPLQCEPMPAVSDLFTVQRAIPPIGQCAVRPLYIHVPAFFAHILKVDAGTLADVDIGLSKNRGAGTIHNSTAFLSVSHFVSGGSLENRGLLYMADPLYNWHSAHTTPTTDIVSEKEATQLITWLKDIPRPGTF